MGKKINPILFRLKKNTVYHSLWYTFKKNFCYYLKCDILIREIIRRNFLFINLSYIDIIISNKLTINLYINNVDQFNIIENYLDVFVFQISKILKKNVILNFVFNHVLNAKNIAYNVVNQILNKNSIKKIIKEELLKNRKNFGCKIQISGRLEGVDIARKEWSLIGRIPLHTIKYNLEYYQCETLTQYGILGVKIWLFKKNNEK
ncbi:ribosomal protein S3 [Candidatus Carsonella ruddii PV]|uniref:Small ribosomal subunit protein uS3 n=1 Tax=Carsonella ruddii (strain PV) TaxID=387662 RepID=RS3_CARRP|nr:30S ribosomal protein S3 [Candidatus Carsonella ruddii]Q05FJ0.1 RecName: Full=Small ribosomal subunit protein uS3; AltName: Full=30S ribosomal protein S3 [Candidatus Carsonella ruddii PV]BAF35181.1 ribosomal protein S3 [Candidatus Carsonella ruddii PV]